MRLTIFTLLLLITIAFPCMSQAGLKESVKIDLSLAKLKRASAAGNSHKVINELGKLERLKAKIDGKTLLLCAKAFLDTGQMGKAKTTIEKVLNNTSKSAPEYEEAINMLLDTEDGGSHSSSKPKVSHSNPLPSKATSPRTEEAEYLLSEANGILNREEAAIRSYGYANGRSLAGLQNMVASLKSMRGELGQQFITKIENVSQRFKKLCEKSKTPVTFEITWYFTRQYSRIYNRKAFIDGSEVAVRQTIHGSDARIFQCTGQIRPFKKYTLAFAGDVCRRGGPRTPMRWSVEFEAVPDCSTYYAKIRNGGMTIKSMTSLLKGGGRSLDNSAPSGGLVKRKLIVPSWRGK